MAYRMHTLGVAALVALAATPVSADVKRGVDAWSSGDFDSAVNEWQLPAQQGDADALFNLAQAYRLGRGVPADITRARELYAQAAEKGHVKAADNYGLLLFQQGEQQAAMPLIRDAAGRGDPRAQYVLGLTHFNADYAEKDWVKAYALLTLAQGSGLPQATAALSQMDQYIPMDQRQKAQVLARQIEEEAGRRRAAELAAVDLGSGTVASEPVAKSATGNAATYTPGPARVAQAGPQPAPEPASQSSFEPLRVPASVRPAPGSAPVSAPAAAPANATAASAPAKARSGSWAVQLGAFGVPANAERLWGQLATHPVLQGTTKALVPGGGVTRLRAVGFANRADAARACDQLKAQGQACMVAKPNA